MSDNAVRVASAHGIRQYAMPEHTQEDRAQKVARLQKVLLETEDEGERARVHLELGRMALEWRRVDQAIRHFKEALVLDPNLENARAALHSLGAGITEAAPGPLARNRGFMGRLLGRVLPR